jgi:hypothetical protein
MIRIELSFTIQRKDVDSLFSSCEQAAAWFAPAADDDIV